MKLSAAQANKARDTLSNPLYTACWTLLYRDLGHFGCEVFPKESFEYLWTKFANETLQQQFNDYAFKAEQREYDAQCVDWKYIEFCDNQD
ncbi:hypothetical protein V7S43_001910 [Phytophthora oleae]|uniref:Myosin motor domain-containing protein n=1 Tax=Phytophthora oleae TaxID=2107226 RepID=A0ABD3G0F6_9STRA